MWTVMPFLVLLASFSCGDNVRAVAIDVPTSTPNFFAYLSDGRWIYPSRGIGGYHLEVGLDYLAVMVCSFDDGRFDVQVLEGHQSDGDQVMVPQPAANGFG